jgi:hypothetical protein
LTPAHRHDYFVVKYYIFKLKNASWPWEEALKGALAGAKTPLRTSGSSSLRFAFSTQGFLNSRLLNPSLPQLEALSTQVVGQRFPIGLANEEAKDSDAANFDPIKRQTKNNANSEEMKLA